MNILRALLTGWAVADLTGHAVDWLMRRSKRFSRAVVWLANAGRRC